MKAQANGMLRHRFFGTYSALIALEFKEEYEATASLPKLGKGWNRSEKYPHVLCWEGPGEELSECIKVLVRFGAEEKKIASTDKSIDYGEPFIVEVPIAHKDQLQLF